MNLLKNFIVLCFLLIFPIICISGCNSGNRLSGTWECDDGCSDTYIFSGKNYTNNYRGSLYSKGTYTITGNRIEFVDSDGDIGIMHFRRTENTIELDSDRYIRKR